MHIKNKDLKIIADATDDSNKLSPKTQRIIVLTLFVIVFTAFVLCII